MCHADFSHHGMIANIPAETYPVELINQLVEAPDRVFIGWAYIDGNFIKPTIPEGFEYDDNSGTFYPIGANLLRTIQTATHPYLYPAVLEGKITKEQFKDITGEDFVENEI